MKPYWKYTAIKRSRQAIFLLALVCWLTGCKDPTKDLSLTVSADVFDYTMAVKLYDAADPGHIPADVKMTVSGTAAGSIYEISGKKSYSINEGFISLGLLKKANPTPGNPVRLVIELTAPGYLSLKIPVRISSGQYERQLTVSMINLDNPPDGVSVKTMQVTLAGDSVKAVASMETPLSGDKKESALLSIPVGTQFKDAAGNVLKGTTAQLTLVHFDTRHASSVNSFPNGSRSSDYITDTAGKKSSGYFQPAGTLVLMAAVGKKAAASFSKNLTVKMSVDGQQWNPATGANYLPGDRISAYRRGSDATAWQQQKPGALTMAGGLLSSSFSCSLATVYTLAYSAATCAESPVLWQSTVSGRDAYVLDVYAAADPFTPVGSYVVQADSNETLTLQDMPSAGVVLKVYPNTPEHPVMDYGKRKPAIGTFDGPVCGGASIMVDPGSQEPFYFDVQGYCSNDNTYIRPTFYVEYALKGSGDFQVLGLVKNGRFTTRNLDRETTYDFRITWGGRVSSLVTRKADQDFGSRITVEVPPGEQETYCP